MLCHVFCATHRFNQGEQWQVARTRCSMQVTLDEAAPAMVCARVRREDREDSTVKVKVRGVSTSMIFDLLISLFYVPLMLHRLRKLPKRTRALSVRTTCKAKKRAKTVSMNSKWSAHVWFDSCTTIYLRVPT